jgi:uncharacterized protein YydD (DUF2326 family)
MRLIELTANKESFHPVRFNSTGLTLVVGAQKNPDENESGLTYNGVGKSLLIALIHYCLGSKKIDDFSTKLPEWEFVLRFEHLGETYRVARNTTNQNVLSLNGEELTTTKFGKRMTELVFPKAIKTAGLSFRGLVSRFARPKKESYNAFDSIYSKTTAYTNLLQSSFLLGLDVSLVTKKHDLRSDQEEVKKLRANLEKDQIFREFFTENKNPEIELADLESRIRDLERKLADFQVAEDFHERQREANAANRNVQALRNELVVVQNAIRDIERSLQVTPDVAPDSVIRVFEEANAALPEQVVKRIEEVAEFHKTLLERRVKRLTAERTTLERRVDRINADIVAANQRADELRRYLGAHGALDEFVAMSSRLSELQAKAQKLRDYRELLDKYSDKAEGLVAEMSRETIRTTRYIRDAKPVLDSNMEKFRSLSKQFYGDRPGGLTVKNNDGENQTRFDIEARIEDDAADGINEVKIFCYDWTLLSQKHNHLVDFLVHDSRLFSDIDPRQRSTIFKIVSEYAENAGLQYIATLNQDQIDSMSDQFEAEEFVKSVTDKVVLKLTDDSPEAKLLGIQVDMQY